MANSTKNTIENSTGISDLKNLIKELLKLNNEVEISYEFDHKFDATNFKVDLVTVSKAIHKEITKFSISFKPPNVIKESKVICKSLLELFIQLNLVVRSTPKNISTIFKKQLVDLVKETLVSTITLINSFLIEPVAIKNSTPKLNITTDVNEAKSKDKYEQLTGLVWMNCDKLASFFKDSLDLLLDYIDKAILQLEDVVEEIDELSLKAQKELKKIGNTTKDEDLDNIENDDEDFDSDFDDLEFDQNSLTIIENTLTTIRLNINLLKTVKHQFKNVYPDQKVDVDSKEKSVDKVLVSLKSIENDVDEVGSLLWDLDIQQVLPTILSLIQSNLDILDITIGLSKNLNSDKMIDFKSKFSKLSDTFKSKVDI